MGFANYGVVFGSFCALTIGTFLIGFFLLGRQKIFRRIIFFLSLIFCSLTVSIYVKHNSIIAESKKQIVGTFKLDIEKSNYDSIIINQYRDLIMTVNNDNTFNFNKATPFFPSLLGNWKYFDDGDISFIECSFDSDNKIFQIQNRDSWTFDNSSNKKLLIGQQITLTRK